MAVPKKNPETKEEVLGYWILQILEFHDRLQKKSNPTLGDFREMDSLSASLRNASEEAGINLNIRPGTIYAGQKYNE